MRSRALLVGVLLLLVALPHSSCVKVPTQSSTAGALGFDVENARIRMRLHEFGLQFCDSVEDLSIQILADAPSDSARRYSALRWKVKSVSVAHRAMVSVDAFAGFLDLWAYSIQLSHYFAPSAPGGRMFGEHQARVRKVVDQFYQRVRKLPAIRAKAEKSGEDLGEALDIWATDHPIQNAFFSRESVFSKLSEITRTKRGGASETVGDVAESARSIADGIALLSDSLPKQVRWQLELLAEEVLQESRNSGVVEEAGRFHNAGLRLLELFEDAPSLLNEQRGQLLELIHEERKITLAEVEKLTDGIIARADDRARSIVNYVIWRVGFLILLMLVGIAIVGRHLLRKSRA